MLWREDISVWGCLLACFRCDARYRLTAEDIRIFSRALRSSNQFPCKLGTASGRLAGCRTV